MSVLELDLSFRLRADEALRLAPVAPDARVADLGCATGAFAARLARLGAVVTCVDADAESLARLRELYRDLVADGRLVPVEAEVQRLPLDDASFDAVFCLEVLEHLVDDRRAVAEAARILAPGALLVVSVPHLDAPRPIPDRLGLSTVHDQEGFERHVRDGYSREQLSALLATAGLDVEIVRALGGGAYRAVTGVVSLGHLAYRRLRGQRSWTWADVERDAARPSFRLYRRIFPLALGIARIRRTTNSGSTLLARARKPS